MDFQFDKQNARKKAIYRKRNREKLDDLLLDVEEEPSENIDDLLRCLGIHKEEE
jgi:hypothetical protein